MKKNNFSTNEITVFSRKYPELLASLIVVSLTFMFAKKDVFFLIYTISILFFCGKLLTEFASGKRFLFVIILSAIATAGATLLFYGYFYHTWIILAVISFKGAIIALLVAAAFIIPNYPLAFVFIGKIKLKYVAMLILGIEFLTINPKSPDSSITALAGVLVAILYSYWFKYRFLISQKLRAPFRRKPKVVYRNSNPTKNGRPLTDDEYNNQRLTEQKEIDSILDKIKENGYESLSQNEKEKLFRASRR